MNKPYFFVHPSMKADIERIQALETFDNPDDAMVRIALNGVEVVCYGEVGWISPFQIIKEPKNNLFKYPPDASIRKL
jgi:hypothetical protein